MKAHQRLIREREADTPSLLGAWWEDVNTDLAEASMGEIDSEKASEIILRYEWLGTMPQAVNRCFGFFHEGVLAGACVFAEKPGANLSSDKTGQVPPDAIYLARGACVHWAHPHAASWFLSRVGKALRPCAILAYSDPAAGEVGTVYQALGWVYLGPSKGGPHGYEVDGKSIHIRSFNRDRKYRVGQSGGDVQAAFPSAKEIRPIPRRSRYLGVYGPRVYRRTVLARLTALPYPKRGEGLKSETLESIQRAECDSRSPLRSVDAEG